MDGSFEPELIKKGQKYPSTAPSWRRAWQEVIPFFAFPPAVRKIIYTTNAPSRQHALHAPVR
jgi:transposase-like protein